MSDVITDRSDAPRYALTLVAIVTELATSNIVNAIFGCEPDATSIRCNRCHPARR
jgi:hypothetical protein